VASSVGRSIEESRKWPLPEAAGADAVPPFRAPVLVAAAQDARGGRWRVEQIALRELQVLAVFDENALLEEAISQLFVPWHHHHLRFTAEGAREDEKALRSILPLRLRELGLEEQPLGPVLARFLSRPLSRRSAGRLLGQLEHGDSDERKQRQDVVEIGFHFGDLRLAQPERNRRRPVVQGGIVRCGGES
jgi:hypothetical protein